MNESTLDHQARRRYAHQQLLLWPPFLLLLGFQTHFAYDKMPLVLLECFVVIFGGVFTLSRTLRSGFWSPGTIFYSIIGLFHLGLVPLWLLNIDPHLPRSSDYLWFKGAIGVQALVLVLLAMSSYVIGSTAYVALKNPHKVETSPDVDAAAAHRASYYSQTGAILTLLGLLAWLYAGTRVGGWRVLLGSYSSWLELTGGSDMIAGTYVLIGIGVGLAVMAAPTPFVRFSLVAFGVFAVVAFFLGLRGEVLFPLAVAATIMAFRRTMPKIVPTLLGIFAALALISLAKVVRQVGVRDSAFSWFDASPLSALAELGSSIRVVATTVIWHNYNGEAFRRGDTYAVSVARLFEALVDPLNRPPASADFRLMNSEIGARAGAIGGSIVGEAFHNFGVPGVVMIFLFLGFLFAYFSTMNPSPTRVAIYICAAVPLFNHVRNSFVPVLPVFFGCILILVSVRTVGDMLDRKAKRPRVRTQR